MPGSLWSICWVHASLCGDMSCTTLVKVLSWAYLLPLGCPRGRFGEGCESSCACRNGGLCHTTNGFCSCPLGWMGPHCEQGE